MDSGTSGTPNHANIHANIDMDERRREGSLTVATRSLAYVGTVMAVAFVALKIRDQVQNGQTRRRNETSEDPLFQPF